MKQSLNFNWKFIPDFEESYLNSLPKEALDINIPHTVKEVPYNYFSTEIYQFISTYEKVFNVEKYDSNRKYYLRFEAFMVKGKIYLNNKFLGEYVSIYNPVLIDVTEYIKDKNNKLVVVLDSKEDQDYPPFGFALDYVTFGGIYREVYLVSEPKTHLKDIFVHGDIDGTVRITYQKVGEDELDIIHQLYFGEELIAQSKDNAFKIASPKLWDIDNPNLYVLKTIIKCKDQEETYETRFGFRKAEFTKDGFFLNNRKVKLIGLNRHQGFPIMGYAAPKSLQEYDAELLKNEVGVNIVRTSHYPQSQHFLNKCDEIGLLVVNEIPGRQHIGQSESWKNACLKNTESMVIEERNHPCIIAHGVRIDESIDDHDLYTKTNEIAHKLDPYRQTLGVRNFKDSELLEDIYGYNDFVCNSLKKGLCSPKEVEHQEKALLVTEYMGHMDPLKATSDEQKKIEVALRHAKVIDDNYKHKDLCGAIGWCFVDYHSHADFGSGDYICPHGVYDLYRTPKYSSYIYASQQEKFPVMKLLSNMKPGDIPEAIFGDIYMATNCDYVELYKDGEFVEKFYPNNKLFKYLKHPPILIDDIVGRTFKEDRFPEKLHMKIGKCFSYAAFHGYDHIKFTHKLLLARIMMQYKCKYADLVYFWNKYVGAWGGKAKTYVFKGYINGKVVKEIEIGPSTKFDLLIEMKRNELINSDTYDVLPIRVSFIDEHKNITEYADRILEVSTKGPIEIIGPRTQTMLGGQLTIFAKSTGKSGNASITIKTDNIEKNIEIYVK